MAKQLLFEHSARIKLQKGVDQLASAVAVTMGPTGRNVIIDKNFGNPVVTKDGVTVSKEIELDDPYENMGAKLVNEVATKTSDFAGDGTTTATVLARAIFEEGSAAFRWGQPMTVRAGSTRPSKPRWASSVNGPKPVTSKTEIEQVGAISANNVSSVGS
ncbi:MAG: hypothetical protein Ct9H300mP1_03400 [Planctomycetaceae bacterium]|nr:MAG: hypothetical protein Ct9H300mP1_03400 [Planctomycetaceae bacterium]